MDEFPQSQETSAAEQFIASQTRRWLVISAVLVVAAGLAFGYGYNQHSKASEMASQTNEMSVTIAGLQNQVSTLNSRLNEMTAQEAATAAAPVPAGTSVAADAGAPATPAPVASTHSIVVPKPRHHTVVARRRPQAESPLKQLQARLDAQQKQLDATEDEVTKTRSDLEGNISSTRDDLNGSIAKNHDELVALEKRTQRAYFEFDLTKSKQFERSGPLMLSLRKADTKHKSYDLTMIVDDNQISKKHVDLYEPIWLHAGDDVQPVQVVVNQIDKDHVHGYISAPKFAESHQASSESAAPSTGPAATQTPAATTPNIQ